MNGHESTNTTGAELRIRESKLPRNEEELLDDVEAHARLGVERGLIGLREDVFDAFGVAPRVRRHPYVALGLGASAGALLALDFRPGAVSWTGRALRPIWMGLRGLVAFASMEAARRFELSILGAVIRQRSFLPFLRFAIPRSEP